VTTTFGILSTYPPTQCGLATFTAALTSALRSPRDVVEIVAVADALDEHQQGPRPAHVWVRSDTDGAAAAAARLNDADVAVIQHEYGIFGGLDGGDVLEVLRMLTVPVIVVLHTVVTSPTLRQRAILDELVLRADAVVTMTHTARERLLDQYEVPAGVHVVPHGAPDPRPTAVPLQEEEDVVAARVDARPTILTWGLLGPGKGIEWGIEAMAGLRDLQPRPRYLVLGETHPKVRQAQGEEYRRRLEQRVADLSVGDLVEFDARYLTTDELHQAVREADVVLLPYDSRDQVTSGVLVEAVTAHRPVVSTGFPHAEELLASGAGILVERGDADSIATAVRRVLTEPGLAGAMSAEAGRIAPGLLWSAVAQQYREVAESALLENQDRMSA
jgi:glycosyltransferase involved in cell wall biosynthesis